VARALERFDTLLNGPVADEVRALGAGPPAAER
jgi:hypothetical protein